jgi:UDP-glucuronate 4-epimerase
MSKYLVTGCAGFIASRVCELLLAEGHDVVGIDNLNDAYDVRLKLWRLEQLRLKSNFSFLKVDVRERAELEGALAGFGKPGFDAIFNLAARAGVRQSVENPWIYYETNTTGVLNLLDCARRFGMPKFVQASTSSLYGSHNPLPFSEDADTNRPLSPYAASKKAAETLCYTYHHLYGIDVTVFRYFTVYGPAGRPDMSLFRFTQWISEGRPVVIYGDGTQSRDFTFVEDIARGTVAGVRRLEYEVVNLGSFYPVSVLEAIKQLEARIGRKAQIVHEPLPPSDVPATCADARKASRMLGWTPQVSFSEGLDRLVSWYEENREWASKLQC